MERSERACAIDHYVCDVLACEHHDASNASSRRHRGRLCPHYNVSKCCPLQCAGGGSDVLLQLDTGAFEPLITKSLADALNLPNLGDIQVEGVGGEDDAYVSKITLSIGGTEFPDIPCIVDPSYSGVPLFGYGFFQDNGYDLLVSQKDSTLTILK